MAKSRVMWLCPRARMYTSKEVSLANKNNVFGCHKWTWCKLGCHPIQVLITELPKVKGRGRGTRA